VSDWTTFWLQLVAYLIVAIFSLMQGYEAYADREWRAVAASAAVFALMCFVLWMLIVR
jgi:amino acid permease